MSTSSPATVALETVDTLRKSWWTVVAGVCVGLAGGMIALHYIPKTFRASTLIFVAPQSVPQEFVRSTVTDDMSIRLQALKESVLSRPYMAKLVEEYIGNPSDPVQLENLIGYTRSRIEVDVINIDTDSRGKAGGTFRLTYRDQDAKRAADMVNSLAQLYIEQNSSSRTLQAEGTTQTIQGLADDLASQIATKQRQLADFRAKHLYETSDQQVANLQQLQGRQQDLNGNAVARAAALDRLTSLNAQQAMLNSAGDGTNAPASGVDGDAQRLAVLERELQALRNRYTETHPEVIAKKREIRELRATLATAGQGEGGSSSGDASMTPLQASIRSAEREIQRLDADAVQIRADIAEYKRRIEATPRVQAELLELSKGYDVLLEQYKRRQGNVEEARGAQKIEETRQGERFEIIERAVPPAIPVRPIPAMIYAAGVFGALLVFVGPIVLKSLLDPVVCSEAGLLELADVPLLITIPRLVTDDIVRAVRGRLVRNVGASLVSIAILIGTTIIFSR